MKKLLILALAAVTAGTFSIGNSFPKTVSAEKAAFNPVCKSAYLCDYESGTEVFAKNETKRLPIASMCKIMTLLLSFEAIDRGELSYDEMITVSENASGMGGSQIFLGANLSYRADELMKSIAVCSANDSCVALAERVGGTEEAFIARMNERAKELGTENTLFANCTGLPQEPQYSCAKDVSVMLRELLKHQKYYEFSKVWLEDFAHPDGRTTQMTNTNKLIRYYDGCDGGKTGFTNEAGFCLAATAKRNDTRLISVVIGSESSKARNATISKLFDYAFNCYESKKILECGQEIELRANVRGSKTCEIPVIVEDTLLVFSKKGSNGNVSIDYTLSEGLKAPVQLGDEVGMAVVYVDGVEACRTRLLAGESAERFSWWDAYRESAQKWN